MFLTFSTLLLYDCGKMRKHSSYILSYNVWHLINKYDWLILENCRPQLGDVCENTHLRLSAGALCAPHMWFHSPRKGWQEQLHKSTSCILEVWKEAHGLRPLPGLHIVLAEGLAALVAILNPTSHQCFFYFLFFWWINTCCVLNVVQQ